MKSPPENTSRLTWSYHQGCRFIVDLDGFSPSIQYQSACAGMAATNQATSVMSRGFMEDPRQDEGHRMEGGWELADARRGALRIAAAMVSGNRRLGGGKTFGADEVHGFAREIVEIDEQPLDACRKERVERG